MLPTFSLYTQIQEASKFLRDPSIRWKIECLLQGLKSGDVTQACRRAGIHRTTFYRWLSRLSQAAFDPEGLRPKSRRPRSHSKMIGQEIRERIFWYRKTFHYGSDRIAWYLCQEPGRTVSAHGVYNVLRRAQMPFRRRRDQKPNLHRKRYNLDRPGQGIQLDIKYVPFPIEGRTTYVFNAIDDCSRWRFQWAYRSKGIEEALDFFLRLQKAAPFSIEQIQTDNDVAFTDRFFKTPTVSEDAYEHPFPKLLKGRGVRHKLLPPGLKELNGKVERSHKTDDQEFYWMLPSWISFDQFQRQLGHWTYEYNHYRPHGGLKMKTPIQKLAACGIETHSDPGGTWLPLLPPTDYDTVVQRLKDYRRWHPDQPFIHWKFRPRSRKTNKPTWLPNTPYAIKALSQINGKTTV